jgi:hypothetical protein
LPGSAACAFCMPCQDAALKDRSSMPPVSVTMQPRNLPVDEAREADPDDGALDDGVLDDGELALVAGPHAVANKAMAPSATALLIVVRTFYLRAGYTNLMPA